MVGKNSKAKKTATAIASTLLTTGAVAGGLYWVDKQFYKGEYFAKVKSYFQSVPDRAKGIYNKAKDMVNSPTPAPPQEAVALAKETVKVLEDREKLPLPEKIASSPQVEIAAEKVIEAIKDSGTTLRYNYAAPGAENTWSEYAFWRKTNGWDRSENKDQKYYNELNQYLTKIKQYLRKDDRDKFNIIDRSNGNKDMVSYKINWSGQKGPGYSLVDGFWN